MKSNSTTQVISYVALGVFLLYTFISVNATALLFSVATGLIVFSGIDSVEIATAVTILVGLAYKYFFGPVTRQIIKATTEGFRTDGGQAIADRVGSLRVKEPTGIYTNPFVEGFADASSATNGQAQGEQKTNATAGESKPAPVDDIPPTADANTNLSPTPKPELIQKFTDGVVAEGLFKLGEIPTEAKGGAHIDQGTTLMNAISSLKPDQIKAMTDDTRKLLDTQKNLMSMLNTMKPMLTDGKQLMDTFQQMFGTNGSMGGNPA